MKSQTSKAMGAITCPICNRRGQLKMRTLEEEYRTYFEVDHYQGNGNSHRRPYDYCCYLGLLVEKKHSHKSN